MFPQGTSLPSTSAKRSQDGKDSSPKKQKIDYQKGGLVHTFHGDIYQLKLLMLFVQRGLDKDYSFRLATEWNAAEKFDDLVFEYKENGKTVYRFVQAKHKQNECKRISMHDLLTQKDDDFSLQKYFISYRKIRSNQEFNGPNVEIKDFVICTNIDLSDDLQNSFEGVVDESDDIIHVAYNSKESKLLKFRNGQPLSKERLVSVFQEASDLKRLADKLANHIFGNDNDKAINLRDELFKKYHAALAEHVIDIRTKKFKFDFINGTSAPSKEVTKFRKVLLDKSKLKSEDEFKRQLQNKDLKISDKFGKTFKIDQNPEITKKGIKDHAATCELAQKIVDLISAANPNDIVTIEQRGVIIKENISKLAGHALIETDDEKIGFRKGFLDDKNLSGNLNALRTELKKKLGTKFSQLGEYRFKNNVHTCTEIDYEKYTKDKCYFESFYCLTDDEVSITEIDEFLGKLVLSVDHPSETELSEVIKEELGKEFNNIDRKNVYSRFLEEMIDWMKKEKGRFISSEDGKIFFDRLKKEILGSIWFNVKHPVRLFTGRKEPLSRLHDAATRSQRGVVVSHMTSVSGLGGIGKSELVLMYASIYRKHYDGNVIGINAESYESLRRSFFDLATDVRLGIPTKDKNGKEKTTEVIVKDVYTFFSKRKSLFIFDNAEQGDDLNKFLPLSCLSPDSNKPSFVITSRDREWEEGIEVIELNVLEIEEAIEFVKRGLNVLLDDKTKDKEIVRLVEKLQCFPLAIQQAISYILYQRNADDFEIDDYILEYDKKADILLNSARFRGIDNNYAKTTFTTWQITTDKISEDEEYGKLALKILDIIGYYASEKINREIFLSLADIDSLDLRSAVRLLVKYSMVNGEQKQSILSVHRLVQDVTRLNVKAQQREKEIVDEGLKLLEQNFPYGNDRREDYEKKRKLLPHCEALLLNVDNFFRKIKSTENRKQIEESYREDIVTLLTLMADGYTDLGNNERRKIFLERALGIQKDSYGDNNVKFAVTQRCLGNAYGDLGNPAKQKEFLESSLLIFKGLCQPDDIEIAKTLSSLGNAYGDLGDSRTKKKYLEQAKIIYETYYGVDSVEVARMVNNLGNVCGELGDPSRQKELLEKALPILQVYYGNNHFQVGRTLNNLSNAFSRLGDPKEQKRLLEQALVIYENHYGKESYLSARVIRNLGTAHADLGNYHEQERLLKKVLRIQEKEYVVDNFEIGRTLNNLSNAYMDLGQHEKQKNLLERALPIFKDRKPELAFILGNLGMAYGSLGDHRKEKELFEESLEIKENHYGPNNFEITKTLRNLGICYGEFGQYDKQMELLKRTLQIEKDHYKSEEHFEIAITLSELGYANGNLGNYQIQKDLLERALPILESHFGSEDRRVTKIKQKLLMTIP